MPQPNHGSATMSSAGGTVAAHKGRLTQDTHRPGKQPFRCFAVEVPLQAGQQPETGLRNSLIGISLCVEKQGLLDTGRTRMKDWQRGDLRF